MPNVIKLRGFKSFSKDQKPRANDFMKEYTDDTWDNPFDRHQRLLNTQTGLDPGEDFASLHVEKLGDNSIHVHTIQSLQKGRGQGTQALNYLKNLADKHQVSLHGIAKSFGRTRGLNDKQLMAWYKRHGFVSEKKGDDEQFESEYIVRHPRPPAESNTTNKQE